VNAERLINRIICGYQYITFKGVIYKLANPSTDTKVAADNLYDRTYQDNLFSQFILKENLNSVLIDTEVITDTFDKDLELTEKQLEKAKISLYKMFFNKKQNQKYRKQIHNLSKLINESHNRKHSLDFLTLEHYCENIKNEYIISQTLSDNNNYIFKEYPNIEYNRFNTLAQLIAQNVIPVDDYKRIARGDSWRKIYTAENNNIFSCSASEYTEEQKALLSISRMYDKVYSHPECPDEKIIEDDDALDGWMLHQQEENRRKNKQEGVSKTLGKAQNANEVFVMAPDSRDTEHLEDIISLNSPAALRRMDTRTTKLEKGVDIEDTYLPDTQAEIKQQLREMNKKTKGI
tara:strand:- start:777 stop:1817 length:1041 start_codon:yes stop_codon:yes gene_type:complete